MPMFDFKCESCGKVEELIVKLSDPPPQCPEGHGEMKKLISVPAPPKFVGSGFYCNEYPKKGK